MSLADATVNVNLSDLNALTDAKAAAEAETAKVRAELAAAKLGSPDGRVANVTAFARDCLTLARFAIAHCPPETIVGWPFDVLHRVADGLAMLPDFSIMDRDMAIDLHAFARECAEYERRRQHVTPGVVPAQMPHVEVAHVVESEVDTATYGTTTFRGEP